MNKHEITFDSIPKAIQDLIIKVNNIELLVKLLTPQQTTPTVDILLTVKEAAKFLDLSVATIYTKTSLGTLPYSKVGKRLYFSKEELTTYIKSGKVLSNQEIEQKANSYLSNSKKA